MIILLVVLIVAVVGGAVVYVVFQYTNVGSGFARDIPRLDPTTRGPVRGSLVQRLEEAPQGCLWGAIVSMAVWIGLWVVVLILGLRVLLA